ncbi:bifunctional RecB family nuclease/DEAD/DEAH box helicase [Rathayibacter sp. AY1B5]|uniref:TM0106 family RecB-like putative nuclease n=1 Tax=Rathayibacter sp. AY1B5 TaxID=2080530 RepID=UPI000CE8487B|nr:bifunctional RecB family nuclease/DEAD/DEAH box helicase [Rathayibacter sp. AY1B5]PPI22855.1 DNA helicase [Rathayibacter sp. AY1B5]
MFLRDGVAVLSPSDLSSASTCEFAFLRRLDEKIGHLKPLPVERDEMNERTSALGDQHEDRTLRKYRVDFGGGVVEVPKPDVRDPAAVRAAVEVTRGAFANQADVVFQGTFADEAFIGFADFIIRRPDGRYRVQDTKLARSAKVTALLQLAAYADQLERLGVPVDDAVDLLLGDGTTSTHQLADVLPVYRRRRARLETIVSEHLVESTPVQWSDPRYTICGQCAHCTNEIEASRDVLLVAGLRVLQRERLRSAGITTIEELASSTHDVNGIGTDTLAKLRSQALLQTTAAGGVPPVEVHTPDAFGALPEPSPGDIYFDFEGDPLYSEGGGARWGLDYLFGYVDRDETFTAHWAHSFAEERGALRAFLADVAERQRRDPAMHIYHYASYERTHLASLAARHGVGVEQVDQMLRDGILVDLYPIVRRGIRIGSPSYSIKKLEPLYMGDELRDGDVTDAAASIAEYAAARDLIQSADPDDPGATATRIAQGEAKQGAIADYNRYDCVSTLRLHRWLLDLAKEAGVGPRASAVEEDPKGEETDVGLHAELLALAGDPLDPHRTDDQTAIAFAAATLDFHAREAKSFWWEHFWRLGQPIDEWDDQKGVLRAERVDIIRDWHRGDRQRIDRRLLQLHGELAAGGTLDVHDTVKPFAVYDFGAAISGPKDREDQRHAHPVEVVTAYDGAFVEIEETQPRFVDKFDDLPLALTPAKPPPALDQQPAIAEWAQSLADLHPKWPRDPVTDLLRRVPPRTRSSVLALERGDMIAAVTATVLDLDDSYLAVQGPPGTGKTYLGSRVIAALVLEHGWKVGVAAQSHKVVDNLLTAVVSAGVPGRQVGKKASGGDSEVYRSLDKSGFLPFASENPDGYVIGGTAWDFANTRRIPRRSLDLLVVDEAGQFSLAFTVAAAVGARNLLLLGDPQQLPQVSQGIHPEPVDQSALGWISARHDVLPPELGYFLSESRRMHPAVAAPVSALSYDGKLRSHPSTAERSLTGIEPGLHARPVTHTGNSTSSSEEAELVVQLVLQHLGASWHDEAAGRSDSVLSQTDFIVVTPYNAQVDTVRASLDAAGLPEVRVGTVDKFQGQEAVVSIVTLAASSATDVPRGMEFLIQKNRLNVAISRAQWASFLLYSPELLEGLPSTPAGVATLSRFIALVGR